MSKRDEWLADTLQKVGLGLFLGAFLKAEDVVESSIFIVAGLTFLLSAYLLTTEEE